MRAQASVEFMFMIMFATAMIVIFMFVYSEMYQDSLREKQTILFSDFGASLQREMMTAAYAKEGYLRTLDIPEDLDGYDYEILVVQQTLIINASHASGAYIIPNSTGQFVKGQNTLRNIDGSICINC